MSALALPASQNWFDWSWSSQSALPAGSSKSWLRLRPGSVRPVPQAGWQSGSESENVNTAEVAAQVRRFQLLSQIERMAALPPGWDSYHAPVPSASALAGARAVLSALFDLEKSPRAVAPTVEGGIELVLSLRPFYASIEIDQDGDIFFGVSDRKGRHEIWQVAPVSPVIEAAIRRLHEMVNG